MDKDFIIRKELFLKTKRQPFEEQYIVHPKKIQQFSIGAIYRVRQRTQPQSHWRAAKIICKNKIKDQQQFFQQINILKQLDHPNIIKIYEIYENSQSIYIVQDLCQGGELFQKLGKQSNINEVIAKKIFRQVLQAIYYCHLHKVSHRDLKPENILFIKKDSLDLKIIDFGVAFSWQKDMKSEIALKSKKNFVGTAYYMAPQIIQNKTDYDQRCDIWSLGVILFILVTSVPPFDGSNPKEIFNKIVKYNYSFSIPELKSISSYLKDLIKKILVPPSQRLTIEQIMQHPWMTSEPNPVQIKLNIKNLKLFSKYSKTQKLAANFLASQLSQNQVAQLTRMFKQIDTNKDGEISLVQLKQALGKQGLKSIDIKALMESIDTDHNGRINYTQFLASVSGQRLFNEHNIHKVFQMLDRDGNGVVDKKQLLQLFSENGMYQLNGKSIDDIVTECDRDGNGVIDFEEFKLCILKK